MTTPCTNQTSTAFWKAMVDSSGNAMIDARLPGLEKRLERSERILERTFRYDISNETHRLNGCRISAVKKQLTGALPEEDLETAAIALYNNKGPSQGIPRVESAIKCDFISCWRFLPGAFMNKWHSDIMNRYTRIYSYSKRTSPIMHTLF